MRSLANPLPIKLVMVATALALALIAGLGWYVWTTITVMESAHALTEQGLATVGEIRSLHDAIAAYARLRLREGPQPWQDRYRALARRRDELLSALDARLASGPHAPRVRDLAEQAAALRSLEVQAFAKAAAGQPAEGLALISGQGYETARSRAEQVLGSLASEIQSLAAREVREQRQAGNIVLGAVSIAVFLLLFTWVASLRISASLVARRLTEEQERAEQDRRAAFIAEVRETLAKGEPLDGITRAIRKHFGIEVSLVWIQPRGDRHLELAAASADWPLSPEDQSSLRQWLEQELDSPGRPGSSGKAQPVVIGDRAFASYHVFPLVLGERRVGAIALFGRDAPPPHAAEAVALTTDLIAHGIERAGAEALLRQYAAELEEANARLEEQAAKLSRSAGELALARDAALESARLKSQFLASVSHEIRTPMTGIIGMTDLTLDTPLNEEQLEYVRLIKNSAQSLLTLMNSILDFSKIEAGRIELEQEPFPFRETLHNALKPLAQRAAEKGLLFRIVTAPEVPEVLVGDAIRLRQIVVNLADNAVKFTERGEVSVETVVQRAASGKVFLQLSVSDTGIGIPKDKHALIFQPFVQADGSTTRKYGGTGLGLAICQQLVRQMGGDIWVDGEPGAGSTFTVVAPFALVEKDPRALPGAPPAGLESRETRCRFLLAEDNPVNQLLVTRLLEKYGHTVVCVGSGGEALEALERDAFDAVLMNLDMPGMGGLEATRAIRQREKDRPMPSGPHVPIVATTASAMEGDRERCLAAGMDAYVSKPIRREELFAAITSTLERFPRARSVSSAGG